MTMTPGTKLGPYEVLSPLGAGGMGEVYRARDTRLGRDVAIKVLPQHLSQHAEVRARFEREAKTISSLNHPHICVLFDVGRENDVDYLVMELIEGETLAARLAKGAMPLPEVVKLGVQIADALDRAHRAGIVHRDLKPGNVMLTKSGAKLMDFGLARATGLAPASGSGATLAALTQSPTIAQPLTAEGTIVGTFQYMSPEQLEGSEADARSDIWALGCVLYEMTTGRHAFEGKSQASLIGAIMNSQPAPVSQFAPMSPPALERLIRQCITRDADERWQSAGDVRRELEWIAGSSSQSSAPVVTPRARRASRGTAGMVAGAVIALAALVFAFGPWRSGGGANQNARLMRFVVEPPPGTDFGRPAEAALSPDETVIAFVANDSLGTQHVFVRPLASPVARRIEGTEEGRLPFWSPDGRMLAFFSKGKLRKVALDGSAPVALCDAPDPRGGAWSKDGFILFAPGNQGPIARVSANGGVATPVTKLDAARKERGHRYPQLLPDGKHFLYVAIGASDDVTTFAMPIAGGEPVAVCTSGSGALWAEPGFLLFLDAGSNANQRRLLAQRFDAKKLRANGDPELLLDPVNSNNFGYANTSAGASGTLVVQHWAPTEARLVWRDRKGALLRTAAERVVMLGSSVSPDASRLAFGGGEGDLYVVDLNTQVTSRLTFENKRVNTPVWSPDGKTIAFSRLSTARGWEIFTKAADGTGPDSVLFRQPGLFNHPVEWTPDGKWLVAVCSDTTGNYDVWRVPMDRTAKREIYQKSDGQEMAADLSRDGRWLVYTVEREGKRSVFVQSFPTPGAKYEVTVPNAVVGLWSDEGDELLVGTSENEILAVQSTLSDGFRQGATTRLLQVPPGEDVAGMARNPLRFLMRVPVDNQSGSRIEVVFNWTKLLEGARP